MTKRKQSWKAIAKRLLGKQVTHHGGDGQFALVTPCRVVHYSFWPTRAEAAKCKVKVDKTGCGGECRPRTHYIVDIDEAK